MVRIEAQIKNKSYAKVADPVISELDLYCKAGEFLGLIGPSGAGKSTLLNIIGGLDQDYSGSVKFFSDQILRKQEDLRLAYLFQEPRLMPWLTVSENIRLVREKKIDYKQTVSDLVAGVGLENYADAYPLQLSGGMQRRVALARALAIEPEVILMDEPFVSLDEPTANRLRDDLLRLWQETKATIIFVTHNLHEAIRLSDRLIFLSTSPASVVSEESITLTRPRESTQIAAIQNTLQMAMPELLGESTLT